MTSFFGDFEARCPKTRPCRIKILHLSFAVPDNNALVLGPSLCPTCTGYYQWSTAHLESGDLSYFVGGYCWQALRSQIYKWQTLFNCCGSQGEFATHCNNSQDQKSKEKVNDAGMMLRWKKKWSNWCKLLRDCEASFSMNREIGFQPKAIV